jgi:hypothetical protein
MRYMNIMKNFFYRIRLTWAVLTNDLAWLAKHAQGLHRAIVARYVIDHYPDLEEEGTRIRVAHAVIDDGCPFIALWKERCFGECRIAYSGTEEDLDELKNQEIIID